MNRECFGTKFSWNGTVYYRCLGDGSVVVFPKNKMCPSCQRHISLVKRGSVIGFKTVQYLIVDIPGIGDVEIFMREDGIPVGDL